MAAALGRGCAVAGLDRADPVRRCRAGDAQRRASGQDRPDRRPVVPAAPSLGSRRPGAPARTGPQTPAALPPRVAARISATSSSRSSARSSRPSAAAAARPATSAGRRPTSCACSSPTARSTSAAGTMPNPTEEAAMRALDSGSSSRRRAGSRPAGARPGLGPARLVPSHQALPGRDRALSCCLRRSVEGRRGSREPWVAVRRDAPQHRLAGHGQARRAGRLDRQGPPARRVERRHGPVPRPRPDPGQAADVHERLGAGRAQGPRPGARAAGRPARRGRRLRPAVRQAALPRGRRRAVTTAWARSSRSSGPRSSAGSGSGSASRTGAPSTTS